MTPTSAPGTVHESGPAEAHEPEIADDLVEEDLLVEEISIDGMCGVY